MEGRSHLPGGGSASRSDTPAIDRRTFLLGGLAAAAGFVTAVPTARAHSLPDVRPRSDWGEALPPTGPLEEEAPEDVRFLLLHHSASGNGYQREDVPRLLGAFYRHHTDTHGWPDIAYNFLVDRFGTVWEGRAGSLEGPVKGDATGGSQGFALLCCFIGDHTSEAPTAAATEAMIGLCAALALRHGIDPSPGARTRFVSRGSSKWPAGAEVETATIAGHRDMSRTTCPGDVGYRLVTGELPARVAATVAVLEEAGGPPDDTGAPTAPQTEDTPSDDGTAMAAPEPRPAPTPRSAPELSSARAGGSTGAVGGGRPPHDPAISERVAVDFSRGGTAPEPDTRWNGLGLRELAVLGVAAAAAGSAAIVAARHTGRDAQPRTAATDPVGSRPAKATEPGERSETGAADELA